MTRSSFSASRLHQTSARLAKLAGLPSPSAQHWPLPPPAVDRPPSQLTHGAEHPLSTAASSSSGQLHPAWAQAPSSFSSSPRGHPDPLWRAVANELITLNAERRAARARLEATGLQPAQPPSAARPSTPTSAPPEPLPPLAPPEARPSSALPPSSSTAASVPTSAVETFAGSMLSAIQHPAAPWPAQVPSPAQDPSVALAPSPLVPPSSPPSTPTLPRAVFSEDSKRHVVVMWDFENLPLGSAIDPIALLRVLQQVTAAYGDISDVKLYSGQVERLSPAMHHSGISIIHCPHSGLKQVVDERIVRDLQTLEKITVDPRLVTVVLISGDSDFAPQMESLGQKGFKTLLITSASPTGALWRTSTEKVLSWVALKHGARHRSGAYDEAVALAALSSPAFHPSKHIVKPIRLATPGGPAFLEKYARRYSKFVYAGLRTSPALRPVVEALKALPSEPPPTKLEVAEELGRRHPEDLEHFVAILDDAAWFSHVFAVEDGKRERIRLKFNSGPPRHRAQQLAGAARRQSKASRRSHAAAERAAIKSIITAAIGAAALSVERQHIQRGLKQVTFWFRDKPRAERYRPIVDAIKSLPSDPAPSTTKIISYIAVRWSAHAATVCGKVLRNAKPNNMIFLVAKDTDTVTLAPVLVQERADDQPDEVRVAPDPATRAILGPSPAPATLELAPVVEQPASVPSSTSSS